MVCMSIVTVDEIDAEHRNSVNGNAYIFYKKKHKIVD